MVRPSHFRPRLTRKQQCDIAIGKLLAGAGSDVHADRSYFIRFHDSDNLMSNTHEWCETGVDAMKDHLTDVSCEELPWLAANVLSKKDVVLNTPEHDLKDAPLEAEELRAEGIRSLAAVPVLAGDAPGARVLGFVGFDAVSEHREWGQRDVARLRKLSKLVGALSEIGDHISSYVQLPSASTGVRFGGQRSGVGGGGHPGGLPAPWSLRALQAVMQQGGKRGRRGRDRIGLGGGGVGGSGGAASAEIAALCAFLKTCHPAPGGGGGDGSAKATAAVSRGNRLGGNGTRVSTSPLLLALVFSAMLSYGGLAQAHGHLTQPPARSGTSVAASGTCGFDRCMWYTNNVTIPVAPTNLDPALLTMRVVPGSADDIYQDHPWRAPGTTPVTSPCGSLGTNHGGKFGADGRSLPPTPAAQQPVWVAGEPAEVAFALTANHGGGYVYRLCRRKAEAEAGTGTAAGTGIGMGMGMDMGMTEECFRRTPLPFLGNTTWVQVAGDKTTRVAYPAVRTSNGTSPKGTTYARNPIPNEPNWPDWSPPGGYAWGHQNIPFNIFDLVSVPSHLPAGQYMLSWRWDTEQTKQVWSNCADVRIVRPPPAAAVTTTKRLRTAAAAVAAAPTEHDGGHDDGGGGGGGDGEGLPEAQLLWKWSEADAGISGGAVLTAAGGVAFGTFLSTGSATPGTNKTFWSLDRQTGQPQWTVDVPTAMLYQAVEGDGTDGQEGVLYFATLGPWVYAVNATTGEVLWRSGGGVPAEYTVPADDFFSGPALLGDTLFVGNYDNHLYALDTRTGRTKWRFDAQSPCNGSPTIDRARGLVVFVSRYDLITALDTASGALVWQKRTGRMLSSPRAVSHLGLVVVGTNNQSVDAFDAATGDVVWSVPVAGSVWALSAAPIDEEAGVGFFGSDDGSVYAIQLSSGAVRWRFRTGGPVESAPAVENGVVVFGSFDGHVYAVNATSGAGLWRYRTGLYVSSVPAMQNGTVYVGSYDGSFYALEAPQ